MGVWIAPHGKAQNVYGLGRVYVYEISNIGLYTAANKGEVFKLENISAKKSGYTYHKSGKYYYIKSPVLYPLPDRANRYDAEIVYTRVKVSEKSMSINDYGKKTTNYVTRSITSSSSKLKPFGKCHTIKKYVTTWYKD